LTFLRAVSLSTIMWSPRISPRSICARIWPAERTEAVLLDQPALLGIVDGAALGVVE
jgi:hypothetical protein